MSTATSPGFNSNTEEMEVSGEHLLTVEANLAAITSPAVRRRWYLASLGCALAGTALTVLLHRAGAPAPVYIAGFAALPLVFGGFGPFVASALGTVLFSFAIEGASLAPTGVEQVRYAAVSLLILVAGLYCERLRTQRIESIDREYRLAQALRRSEAMRIERAIADTRQAAERDRAQAEIRERDQQLARITASIPGIVYQLLWKRTGETRYLYVSEQSRDVFNLEPEVMLRDPSVAWQRVHRDDMGAILRNGIASMDSGAPWRCEFRISDPAHPGTWRWVLGSAVCQPTLDADTALFTGIFTDITEQRRLEDDLRQSQRIESLGRLAGGVAHDFNNLLTAISGEASLLESDAAAREAAASDELLTGLRRIRSAAESGAALSKQLLGFARRQVMSPKVVDVNGMIDHAAPLIRRLLVESIRLELHVAPAIGNVRVDPGLFDQVLLNLAANARDAMPRGGTLVLEARSLDAHDPARAMYAGIAGDRVVEVVVTDSGVGMAEAVRERAFEPFFTTKAVGEGSGLGLSTSYGIVTQAGGVMLLESGEGTGTTVRMAFPWRPPSTDKVADEHVAPQRGTERVLVVDDDDQVRHVTAEALRRFGYDVLEARSGYEALERVRSQESPIALLVSDVVMPELSGVAMVEAMHAEGLFPRVLFVSGYPEGTVTQHGVVPEGVELLEKPYAVAELLRRVRAVLDRRV